MLLKTGPAIVQVEAELAAAEEQAVGADVVVAEDRFGAGGVVALDPGLERDGGEALQGRVAVGYFDVFGGEGPPRAGAQEGGRVLSDRGLGRSLDRLCGWRKRASGDVRDDQNEDESRIAPIAC